MVGSYESDHAKLAPIPSRSSDASFSLLCHLPQRLRVSRHYTASLNRPSAVPLGIPHLGKQKDRSPSTPIVPVVVNSISFLHLRLSLSLCGSVSLVPPNHHPQKDQDILATLSQTRLYSLFVIILCCVFVGASASAHQLLPPIPSTPFAFSNPPAPALIPTIFIIRCVPMSFYQTPALLPMRQYVIEYPTLISYSGPSDITSLLHKSLLSQQAIDLSFTIVTITAVSAWYSAWYIICNARLFSY